MNGARMLILCCRRMQFSWLILLQIIMYAIVRGCRCLELSLVAAQFWYFIIINLCLFHLHWEELMIWFKGLISWLYLLTCIVMKLIILSKSFLTLLCGFDSRALLFLSRLFLLFFLQLFKTLLLLYLGLLLQLGLFKLISGLPTDVLLLLLVYATSSALSLRLLR